MHFIPHTKMADIIHENYLLLPILGRFNIQLGFADKTVEEVCNEKGVNLEFFLVIINSFHDPEFFPEEHLRSFPLAVILDYIRNSHNHYLNYKLPQIESYIKRLVAEAGEPNKKHFELIEKFFSEYKEEVITHIQDEENRIFPYITSIDKLYNQQQVNPEHRKLIRENTISVFASEHTNMEDKLFDLKNIMIKYMPPVKDYSLYNMLLFELFRLEKDLRDHARIEDNVMVPKVQLIENELLKRVGE